MKREELFKSITKLEDFAEISTGNAILERSHIKEELLNEVPLAIFFTCCEDHKLTYNECLFLIQTLANKTFKNNGERLFANIEGKGKMIPIWDIMKKLYTNKLCFNYLKEDLIYLRSANIFANKPFIGMYVKLGKEKNKLINYSKAINKKIYFMPYSLFDEDACFLEGLKLKPKDTMDSLQGLYLPLGVDENKKMVYADLYELKHLLVSGAPRSGKSICLHTLITYLLLKNNPEELRLVLIDPKGVEFDNYKDLPHLAMPILTDSKSAVAALKWITKEIEKRIHILESNEHLHLSLFPEIVIVADEYSDLIMDYKEEAMASLSQIIQKGAQVGVHIILSTARPTKDIIYGTLKAAIPNRIAFRVARDIDSEVIIDKKGAENLKGKGEMLFKNEDTYTSLQGILINEEQIEKICIYIRENYSQEYLLSKEDLDKIEIKVPQKEIIDEKLLYEVALYCIETGTININSIQLKFYLRFNIGLAILQELEKRGIVSGKQGVKGRTILVDKSKLKELIKV